jgi:uncharacterized membrane protein YoaK (UPF0700 family)
LAGSGGLPVVAPIVSLAAFLVGSAVGGRLAVRRGDRSLPRALWFETASLAAATIVAAAVNVRPSAVSSGVVIGLLALGMGIRNATVRKLRVPDLTTTVLTMTLTGLAADSRVAGGTGAGSVRRISAVLAMLLVA